MLPSERERVRDIANKFVTAVSHASTHVEALSSYWMACGYIRALADLDILDAQQCASINRSLSIQYAKWKQPS